MHSLQVGKLCTCDTLVPTGVRFSVYFLLYIVARDQAGLLALCDVSSWLEDASAGVALAEVSPWLEDASAGLVFAESVVVDPNISGKGLKMLAKTEGFCWGMRYVRGDLETETLDRVFGAGVAMSDLPFNTLVPALLGMCSYTICL